jgi:hypothetical protein
MCSEPHAWLVEDSVAVRCPISSVRITPEWGVSTIMLDAPQRTIFMDESWRCLPMTLGVRRTQPTLTDSVVRDNTPMSSTGLSPPGVDAPAIRPASSLRGIATIGSQHEIYR